MGFTVKLILPDNLRSTYLRGEFVEGGATYSTASPNPNKLLDTNSHRLSFGFELVNALTREPVDLKQIESLRISNDPNFEVNSTVEITDWPNTPDDGEEFDNTHSYTIVLDADYFFGDSGDPILSRSVDSTPTAGEEGFFFIEGWPLSANGGASTVYFHATVKSVDDESSSYPGDYGIFDQILWQSELPSVPGLPWPNTLKGGWTGKRTNWRFRGSEEPSTGVYSSGVSRYVGDVLEIRGGDVWSSLTYGSGSGVRRLIGATANNTTGVLQGYSYVISTNTYTSGSDTLQAKAITAGNGYAFYSNSVSTLSDTNPDFCVNAHVELALDTDATSGYLAIKAFDSLPNDPGIPTDEVEIRLTIPAPDPTTGSVAPVAQLKRTVGSVVNSAVQTTTLPESAWGDILNGGVLELYVDNRTAPSSDNQMIVQGYFTPDNLKRYRMPVVRLATTAVLPSTAAIIYNNGTNGVGATLTRGENGALGNIDSVTAAVGDRILVKNQASASQNGIYVVTSAGSGGAPYVLTRANDFDEASDLVCGAIVRATAGSTNGNTAFTLDPSSTGAYVMGTTSLSFTSYTSIANIRRARLATTENITLSGLQVIDGEQLEASDRVLVKNQASPQENGVYAAASGAWTRVTDMNGAKEFLSGMVVLVTEGKIAKDQYWELLPVPNGGVVLETTPLLWATYEPKSYLLASALVPKFGDTATVGAAVVGGSTVGGSQFNCTELAWASGKNILDADWGDCKGDELTPTSFPSVSIEGSQWLTAIRDGEVQTYFENVDDTNAAVDTGTPDYVLLTAEAIGEGRSITEIEATCPSFSDRVRVDVAITHVGGEFYVALSGRPVYDQSGDDGPLRPMASRCDTSSGEADEPILKPTTLIGFSASEKQAYVAQRLSNNTQTIKTLFPYEPNSIIGAPSDRWVIEMSTTAPNGESEGLWVTIYRGAGLADLEVIGVSRLDMPTQVADLGLGYYVAVGVRSDRPFDFDPEEDEYGDGEAKIYSWSIRGLSPLPNISDSDPIGYRHFQKATAGTMYAKALLGQNMLSGMTDEAGFFALTDAQRQLEPVRAASTANLTLSGTQTVDSVALVVNDRVLVKNQSVGYQNGIYVVQSGAWKRAADLSESIELGEDVLVAVTSGSTNEATEWSLLPPISEYIIDSTSLVWLEVTPPTRLQNVRAASTDNLTLINQQTIDGVDVVAGDRVLVKNQTDSTENGIYVVQHLAAWTRATDLDASAEFKGNALVRVELGIENIASNWKVPPMSDFTLGTDDLVWQRASKVYAQRFSFSNIAPYYTSLKPQLLDLRMRPRKLSNNQELPRIRFYADVDGEIDSAITTSWVIANRTPFVSERTPQTGLQSIVPQSGLAQFSLATSTLNPTVLNAQNNTPFWLVVEVPEYCDIAYANSSTAGEQTTVNGDGGETWYAVTSMWHKLFAKSIDRHDNILDSSVLHSRVRADSHAQVCSQPSGLAHDLYVDLLPPADDSTPGRPLVETSLPPSVRTVSLAIKATDEGSGVCAFRVGKEIDYGRTEFGPWQPWLDFYDSEEEVVDYIVYLYGIWSKTKKGEFNSELFGNGSSPVQNVGSDGPRRVWVQVMDYAGNISESLPFTALAQAIALVDTTPPTGSLVFVDPDDGEDTDAHDSLSSVVKLTTTDRVSEVRDFRLRSIGLRKVGNIYRNHEEWSNWRPLAEYAKWKLDGHLVSPNDGLKRVEAQVRDYGNNIIEPAPLIDKIYDASGRGVTLMSSAKWTSPTSAQEDLYLGGMRTETYDDLDLEDALDPAYPSNKAFFVVSSDTGLLHRRILLREGDDVVVEVNSVPWTRHYPTNTSGDLCEDAPDNSFRVDAERGLVVFCTTLPSSPTLWASVVRNSATLYRWQGQNLDKVADLGFQSEKAILDMEGTSDALYLACGTGKVWRFNGDFVEGPVLVAANGEDSVPVTTLHQHQFWHESEPYIYAATAVYPKLYRAKVSEADLDSAWETVADLSQYFDANQSDNRHITCATSAYNSLFLGTAAGRVLRYERKLTRTNDSDETESITVSQLRASSIGLGEGAVLPVSCLMTSGNQVLAGIGDRPEVWRFSQSLVALPKPQVEWSTQQLFANDPFPWQYYDSTYRKVELVVLSPTGGLESLPATITLKERGGDVAFTWSAGDYPISQVLINGIELKDNFVLNPGAGTIQIGTGAFDTPLADSALQVNLRGDATTVARRTVGSFAIASPYTASGLVAGLKFSGGRNETRSYALTTGGDWEQAISNKTKWTFELEMMHLDGDGAQGFKISDGRYEIEVGLTKQSITVQSGSSTVTRNFAPWVSDNEPVSAFGLSYPEHGTRVLWNFQTNEPTAGAEDSGPYFIGTEDEGDGDLNGWVAEAFVVSPGDYPIEVDSSGVAVAWSGRAKPGEIVEEEEVVGSAVAFTHMLRLTPTDLGNPRISRAQEVSVDSQSKALVRARVVPKDGVSLRGASLRWAWSDGSRVDSSQTRWSEVPLVESGQFETYTFEPSWFGTVRGLQIEVVGLPEGADRPDYVDIDYIAIVSSSSTPSITDSLTPVRVAVDGTRVMVWVGAYENPIIDQSSFLKLPTTTSEIRLGKLDSDEDYSEWAYGALRFSAGKVQKPVATRVQEFALAWRFPSTGGVRCMSNHLGTAWAFTDGIADMRLADNPDDRAAKCFSYHPTSEVWQEESPAFPRLDDGQGIVRPLVAESFFGRLVVSGQTGQLSVP